MKTAGSGLKALLAGGRAYRVELLTITLANGTVIRLCDGDQAVTFSGNSYATSPKFERTSIRQQIGFKSSDMDLKLYATPADLIGSVPFSQLVALQIFDAATVTLQTVYSATYGDVSLGAVTQFVGYIYTVTPNRFEIAMKVKSKMQGLNLQIPYNVWQPVCVHRLYDVGCTLLQASYSTSFTVASGSTFSLLKTNASQANAYYDLGKVAISTGSNAGFSRSVKTYLNANGAFTLSAPLPFQPQIGDTLIASPGCDKTQGAGGCAKFSNTANFKAVPFVPTPESMIR